jgi:hypothetical protein
MQCWDTGTNLVIIINNNNGIAIVGWFFVVVYNLCLCIFENFHNQRTSGWGCGLKVFRIKECPFQVFGKFQVTHGFHQRTVKEPMV